MNHKKITGITVIRHGETEWNKIGLQQGHLNSNLTILGIKQAETLANALSEIKFDHIYSSDLLRAFDTAKIISKKMNLEIKTDPRLRERNLGIMQGLTIAEFKEKFPEEYAKFISDDPDVPVKNGESKNEHFKRVKQCIVELGNRHIGENILIVTHGGVIEKIFRFALGIPLEAKRNFSLFNSSINTFTFQDNILFLKTWGDINHLKEIGTTDDF